MTTTALPALDDHFSVTADTVASYRRDGHVVVRGLASSTEAHAYRPIIEAAALETAWDRRPLSERDTYGKAFLQSFNLWRVDDDIARFVLATRFAGVAASLLGVPRVRLYHDQALCKEAGGGRTPWHQDQYYWPIDTDATITMWMPMLDVTPAHGSITFASGSHRLGDLRGRPISDESDADFATIVADRSIPCADNGALAAGDASFHSGWTIHCAGPNTTDVLRTAMTVIYVADGARVPTELSEAQDFDRKVWLAGTAPGALIDAAVNPLI